MAIEPIEKFREILQNSEQPLICIPENPSGDAIGAAWALYACLQNLGKSPSVACSDPFGKMKDFEFLPKPSELLSDVSGSRDFILIFNVESNGISNVRTENSEKELRIYLTPKRASIDPRDFSFIPGKCKYDTAIFLGCREKESIGKVYEENPDVFFEIPIVNIDYKSNNEEFGQLNVLNLTASSTSEILADAIMGLPKQSMNENVAKCLLAGIISETDSFRKKNTTPKALYMAAKLIEFGADQQEVIRHLYKTQPFHLLKLLGRIMAHLNWNEEFGFVWAEASLDDFVQTRTKPSDLGYVLDTIRNNYSSGKIFGIFYKENHESVSVIMKSQREDIILKMQNMFSGKLEGDAVIFPLSTGSFEDAFRLVVGSFSE